MKRVITYLVVLAALFGGFALAQNLADIEFPIPELGNCQSQEDCKTYCDDVNHIEDCLSFARTHNLMTQVELSEAEAVLGALKAGAKMPGGCVNKENCEEYCQDYSHITECLDFAEAAGFISGQELQEARQVAKAVAAGIKPPNCWGKEECDIYCDQPTHMEECVNFALAAGLIPEEEAAEVKKILPLMMSGEMPGGCIGKKNAMLFVTTQTIWKNVWNLRSRPAL